MGHEAGFERYFMRKQMHVINVAHYCPVAMTTCGLFTHRLQALLSSPRNSPRGDAFVVFPFVSGWNPSSNLKSSMALKWNKIRSKTVENETIKDMVDNKKLGPR